MVVKDEIERIYSQNGPWVSMPSPARTAPPMWSASLQPAGAVGADRIDRLLNPVLRGILLGTGRGMEERRRSYDSKPQRRLVENFLAAAFMASPYGGRSSDGLGYSESGQAGHGGVLPHLLLPGQPRFLAVVGDVNSGRGPPGHQEVFRRIPRRILPLPPRPASPSRPGAAHPSGERRQSPVGHGFHKPNALIRMTPYAKSSKDPELRPDFPPLPPSGGRREDFRGSVRLQRFPGSGIPTFSSSPALPPSPYGGRTEKALLRELEELKKEPVF